MFKICLTGGPCGGKSTSIAMLEQQLSARGFKVFVVPETATELITAGVIPNGKSFQEKIFLLQLAKEKIYEDAAKEEPDSQKVVIIYDRGLIDQLAYISREDFLSIAQMYNMSESDMLTRYDAVYHLMTAAKGTQCYTTANNPARYESAADAIIKDNKTIAAWTGHPHFRVIDNSTGFEEKILRLINDVFHTLGSPVSSEIEKKYLIKRPSKEILSSIEYISKSDICQIYLLSNDESERRIRQRGTKGSGFAFYYTEKKAISPGIRIENEKKISFNEYIVLLSEADSRKKPIVKERYCFLYKNQYFELDIYPVAQKEAILEIELNDINDKVELPDFLEIIGDVTDAQEYKNSALSSKFILKATSKNPLLQEHNQVKNANQVKYMRKALKTGCFS